MLRMEHISFTYGKGTPDECQVLKDVSLTIGEGEFLAVIGPSGCGKTTLIKHMNGLLKADSGTILYQGKNIYDKSYKLSAMRKEVAIVFQYPEQQLFESTVIKDVCFGPKNLGMSPEEAMEAAKASLARVGLDETYYHLSPWELSGGQKRRVAIAGMLAMRPKVLVMDEPAAGLDPATRHDIFRMIKKIQKEDNVTIVLVSHHMEDVALYAERVLVMNRGCLLKDGPVKDVFADVELLESLGIGVPQVTHLLYSMKNAGIPVPEMAATVDEAEKVLLAMYHGGQEVREC